ncbi:hypothetical protein LTR36_008249 [Oleoguttula mirabilis]|uniref:Brl1/Brr6 domain-containing protein n=1 Tax=Oleoguttula mirabilis TaxID=1507867 RepID=A0AAV9J8J5_9PEZI|nr:hypothetical protein LTR36_008249 [Oleoguttula mirabilis]
MSRYTHSGMDFQYDNGTGPVDVRSPFATLSQNAQRFPPATSNTKKRSYSAFDPSPKRSSPSKPLPPTPAWNAMFSTPHKAQNDFDDSSAGETPRSPEQKDDSDATPDHMNLRSPLSRIDAPSAPTLPGAERLSPLKEKPSMPRRDSWMVRLKNRISPGRGEIPRVDHSGVTDRRIEKRRKRDVVDRKVSRRRRHSVSDSGDDSERPPPTTSPRKTSSQLSQQALPEPPRAQEKKPFWLTSFFTFIAQHPTVPHILSWYAQLAFNLFLLGGCAYLIFCFWSAVQGDVDKKSHEAMADIMAEMAICAQQYTKNQCDRSTRVPALETVCENWAKCMTRDPARVGRAKVSAHTFAEIFNSFVEPISYKAMAFSFILIFGCFGISNFAFGFFRKTEGGMPQQFQGYYQQPPPPTPQRTFSGQDGNAFYGGGTPWQQHQPLMEPQPSAGYGQIEGRGSPVRRLQY